MNETPLTVVGNLTDSPDVRFTASGAAVANFTVASTPRKFDKATGQWQEQEALFLRCSCWRQMAENVSESLTRGQRVVVQGRLRQRSYENRDGEKRTVVELEVDDVGPSLRWATATVRKVDRSGPAPAEADPWGQPPPAPARAGGGSAGEPPF